MNINPFNRYQTQQNVLNQTYVNNNVNNIAANTDQSVDSNRFGGFNLVETFAKFNNITSGQPEVVLPGLGFKIVPTFPYVVLVTPEPLPTIQNTQVIDQRNKLIANADKVAMEKEALINAGYSNSEISSAVNKLSELNIKEQASLQELIDTYPQDSPQANALQSDLRLKNLEDQKAKLYLQLVNINMNRSSLYNSQVNLDPGSIDQERIAQREAALQQVVDGLKEQLNGCNQQIAQEVQVFKEALKSVPAEDKNLIDTIRQDHVSFAENLDKSIQKHSLQQRYQMLNELERASIGYESLLEINPIDPQELFTRFSAISQAKKQALMNLRSTYDMGSPQDKAIFATEQLVDNQVSVLQARNTMNASLESLTTLAHQMEYTQVDSPEYQALQSQLQAVEVMYNNAKASVESLIDNKKQLEETVKVNMKSLSGPEQGVLMQMLISHYGSEERLNKNEIVKLENRVAAAQTLANSNNLNDTMKSQFAQQAKELALNVKNEKLELRIAQFRMFVWQFLSFRYKDQQEVPNLNFDFMQDV